jgi:hypothetical protein
MKTRLVLFLVLLTGPHLNTAARAFADDDGGAPGGNDGGATDAAAEDAAAADAVDAEVDAAGGGGAQVDAAIDAPVLAPGDAGGVATADAAVARDAATDVAARPSDGGRYNLIGDDDGCSYGRGGRGAWWLSGLTVGGFAIARRLRRSGRATREAV